MKRSSCGIYRPSTSILTMKMKLLILSPTIVASAALLLLSLCPTRYTHSNGPSDYVNYLPAISFVVVVEGTSTTTSSVAPTNNHMMGLMRMRRQNQQRPRSSQCQEDERDEEQHRNSYFHIPENGVFQRNHYRSSSSDSSLSISSTTPNTVLLSRRKQHKQRRNISTIQLTKATNRDGDTTSLVEAKQQGRQQCNKNRRSRNKHGGQDSQSSSMLVQQCSSSGISSSGNNSHGNNGNKDGGEGNYQLRDSPTIMDSQANYRTDRSGGRPTQPTLKKVLTPPSVPPIKLIVPQPRKKELWLPWPLGAIRNDFYSFAASEEQRRSQHGFIEEDEVHRQQQHQSQWPQWQIQQDSIMHRSRDWTSRMLHRGGGSLRRMNFPALFHGSRKGGAGSGAEEGGVASTGRAMGDNNIEYGNNPRYWSKDPTTSMATASATVGKKDKNNKFEMETNTFGMKRPKQQQYDGSFRGEENNAVDQSSEHGKHFDKDVVLRYLKLQASVRLRQLGYVGSDFSIHLPPAAPVLLFYYMLPSKQDPIRRLVKYSLTGAALSWMHSEATKYRRFSPLPVMRGVNVRRPNLPPFLPEEWAGVDGVGGGGSVAAAAAASNFKIGRRSHDAASASKKVDKEDGTDSSKNSDRGDGEVDSQQSPHHLWDPFQSFGTISSAYRTWLEGHNMQNKQLHQQRRIQVRDQLLMLKKTSSMSVSNSTSTSSATTNNSDMGYALVTGASSGIGRALAVELARYQIPLILVARDLSRLRSVAEDIETHYDVPCRILRADLSSPDSASRIHAATKSAGLNVDILVNNAGVCTHGDFVDGDERDMAQMMLVNIGAVTQLSRLYGEDMKERRRGRILFVSSMCGVLPGNPGVAVYAASTAYKKSLAISLGREMERFGVGVTCLLPGAVKDTSFASRSGVEQAACFHFPGYAKSAEVIAGEGVKGLMLGYPEVFVGWHNRVFAKAVLPMLPQRFSIMIGEWAWNPWQWGDVMPQRRGVVEKSNQLDEKTSSLFNFAPSTSWKFLRPPPSNQIQLPEVAKPEASPAANVSPPAIEIVEGGDIANSIRHTEVVSETLNMKLEGVISDRTHDEALAQTIETNAADHYVEHQGESNQIEETKNMEVVAEVPAPRSLELPPSSALLPIPPPSDAVVIFETGKISAPSSSDESLRNHDAQVEGSTESHQSSDDNNQTWYPSMMDKRKYDFYDRRLNY